MRWLAAAMTLLALFIVLLSNSIAQDNKDPAKDDKKEEVKKDQDKKDEKKSAKKEAKREPEEKVVYGTTITAKLKRMDPDAARDFTIEVSKVDPNKVSQFENWKVNELSRISRIQNLKDRAQNMSQFQVQMAVKQTNEIYSWTDMDVRASENCKVRTKAPPIEYDDKGNLKKYTQKELNALKGTSKLPGYPSDLDHLTAGQIVTLYMAKTKPGSKIEAASPKKKSADDDSPPPPRPEVVMIVVEKEAPPPK
jgi:hypothetical protein